VSVRVRKSEGSTWCGRGCPVVKSAPSVGVEVGVMSVMMYCIMGGGWCDV